MLRLAGYAGYDAPRLCSLDDRHFDRYFPEEQLLWHVQDWFHCCAAPHAVSVSLVRRPVMVGIVAGMDQKDSCSGMYKASYAGCDALRAVSFSLVWQASSAQHSGRYGPEGQLPEACRLLVFLGGDFYEFLYSALSLVR